MAGFLLPKQTVNTPNCRPTTGGFFVGEVKMKCTYTRMTPDIEHAVDHLAKADDRSFSTMVRVLVKESLHARGALPATDSASRPDRRSK
jgi:hypothetical protein